MKIQVMKLAYFKMSFTTWNMAVSYFAQKSKQRIFTYPAMNTLCYQTTIDNYIMSYLLRLEVKPRFVVSTGIS